HVAQDQVRGILAGELQADAAVLGADRGVALDLEHQHDVVADARLVFDDENLLRRDGLHQPTFAACRTGLSGSTSVNSDPAPTELLRLIAPPCSSTSFLTIARPSPVPGRFSTFEAR